MTGFRKPVFRANTADGQRIAEDHEVPVVLYHLKAAPFDLGQKGIAEPPGPGLEPLATHGPIISDSQPPPVARQPELRRKLDNERPVISRLSTEVVLRMGHQDGYRKHAA